MIDDIIKRFGGKKHDANEWWPDGAMDDREVIVELPWSADHRAFRVEMDRELYDNPIQYISDDIGNARFFLYYAE